MKYDFDTVIDRTNTNSLKYDFAKRRGKPEDVLPMWVADMDFQVAPAITKKLNQVTEHAIFGYSESHEDYFKAVAGWFDRHYGWQIEPCWLVKTPSVVFALAMAVRAYTDEGDAVLIQQPVYYPFSEVIEDNHRKLINSPLKLIHQHYEIDFEDFENKITENQVKLFIMCSPHNPGGRVWKEWELRKIGDICLKHGVIIVSDEIHEDLTFPGNKHLVFANLSPAYADITITCTSPSKTFNIAGLHIANIFIANATLRRRFKKEVAAAGYSQVGVMGMAGAQAAYEDGEEWLTEVKAYINDNLSYLRTFLMERLPEIELIEPEGTYLVWMDFRKLGMTEEEREDLVVNKAKLWLDSGSMFGKDGEGFERINIACPRATLKKALEQLEAALKAVRNTK
jgi:cystathionine beta-lyase